MSEIWSVGQPLDVTLSVHCVTGTRQHFPARTQNANCFRMIAEQDAVFPNTDPAFVDRPEAEPPARDSVTAVIPAAAPLPDKFAVTPFPGAESHESHPCGRRQLMRRTGCRSTPRVSRLYRGRWDGTGKAADEKGEEDPCVSFRGGAQRPGDRGPLRFSRGGRCRRRWRASRPLV